MRKNFGKKGFDGISTRSVAADEAKKNPCHKVGGRFGHS